MNRMTAYMSDEHEGEKKKDEESVLDYFASHPSTQNRVDLANRYSECFKPRIERL